MSVLAILASALLSGNSPSTDSSVTWQWDRESVGCDLKQRTNPGATSVTIGRNPASDETRITFRVRSPSFAKGYYPDGTVKLSAGQSFAARVQVYSAENRSYWLQATVNDPAFLGAFATASTISIGSQGFGSFDAQLSDSAPAAEALHKCEESRLRLWGIDPVSVAALKTRPVPTGSLAELFSSFDYPGVGLSGDFGADIVAKLDVAEDGSVRSCTWLGPKKFPQFGEAICKGLKDRARFEPARDAAGHPAAAPYVTWAAFRTGAY